MRRKLALICAALVSSAALGGVPASRAVAGPDDGEAALEADADGPLRIRREGGVATFVGTPAGTDIDNPGVGRGTGVSAAARSHLTRYGDAIGADRPGTRLVENGRSAAAAGSSVVRFQQEVDGLPVLGGDVVVTLDRDHDLASLDARLSEASSVASASVPEDAARTTALATAGRGRVKGATAEDLGRWVLDPETVPVPGLAEARSAWRFEVRAGVDVRRMVLVDDRSGVVLLDVDLIQHADRVVCDQASALVEPAACRANPTRTEGDPASGVADVDDAYDNAGRVSSFYEEFGAGAMTDLTNLIGLDTANGKKLASTVRVCLPAIPEFSPGECPYDNAYWNGEAMFYGENYPKADDIVGHEMTHGVIERTSGLVYYDQSGAINESLADIIGEIVDHRNGTDDDSAFDLGEDLPGGPIRSMKDPGIHDDPDRVTSADWYPGEADSGGVHWNSGVGNKAFYLISQGGSFNGQTITGVDAGDPGLEKSARLWTQVVATVPAFARYDDLATVLEQACATLQSGGHVTSTDCADVHKAVLATEMTKRPVGDPVRQASRGCPVGTVKRVLLSPASEGAQEGFAAASGGWTRLPAEGVLQNAYSGDTAWYAEDGFTGDGGSLAAKSLQLTNPVTLPTGQRSYLAFRHWHAFEYSTDYTDGSSHYWDGGTVELARVGLGTTSLSGRTWAHGPTRVLEPESGGIKAFAGTSKDWYGSRVDLSAFAGQRVMPRFTMRYDQYYGAPGWYVDDIEVYTCGVIHAPSKVTASGTPYVGRRLTALRGTWSPSGITFTYQWLRDGRVIAGATRSTFVIRRIDKRHRISVRITGKKAGYTAVVRTSPRRLITR